MVAPVIYGDDALVTGCNVCPDNEPGTLGDFSDVVVQSLKALDAVQKALQNGTKECPKL